MKNPFSGLDPTDISGQFDALRHVLRDVHGVALAPNAAARAVTRAALQDFGVVAVPAIDFTADLLSDLEAAGELDVLLDSKGIISGKGHTYVFAPQDIAKIDPTHDMISLLRTKANDSFFAVHRMPADAQVPMTVMSRNTARDTRLYPEPMHSHTSLMSWLVKFLLPRDLGRSMLFANYVDDPKVTAFHAAATALYGAPAWIAPDCALYLSDNVMFTLRGDFEPWLDMWVMDQTQPWARNADLLSIIQLTEEALAKWAQEASTP